MIIDKLVISGYICVETGLHIGGTDTFSAIGEADSTIIRDAISNEPIIPGSSLKGKKRTLLTKDMAKTMADYTKGDDSIEIYRLFGGTKKIDGKDKQFNGRLIYRDCKFNKEKSAKTPLEKKNVPVELKMENNINRLTSVANPRSLERVPAGNVFDFELIYNVENEEEIKIDMENIKKAMDLLELDYLGGNGTRGYGKVKFTDLYISSFNNLEKYENICENILL